MQKEAFEHLYSIIDAIAHSKDLSETLDTLGRSLRDNRYCLAESSIREEAARVITLMDQYEELKIPFMDITEEEIQKAHENLKERYGFVLWSNVLAGTEEICAEIVQEEPDAYRGYDEDSVRRISMEYTDDDKEILKDTLEDVPINGLVITGKIGRWDGQKSVFALQGSLRDLFQVFTGDGCTLYIKDGQLQAENCHHDGTDQYTFYTLKPGVDPESISNRKEAEKNWKSLVPILAEHFGWEDLESLQKSVNGFGYKAAD